MAVAVALLAASAAGRAWQARRVDQALRDGRLPPFHVAEIPMTLGPWTGQDIPMDPQIAKATGSSEQIQRRYQNGVTGQYVDMIFLYGPSSDVFIHAPEVCYPAAGYDRLTGPNGRAVTSGDRKSEFGETVYTKGEGGTVDQQQVYCSWHHSGSWGPSMITRKGSERIPGMFKVQISRALTDREMDLRAVGDPCQSFLTALMPEIDRRIAEGLKARAPR